MLFYAVFYREYYWEKYFLGKMFNASNITLPYSDLKSGSDRHSCDDLHLFFKDVDKDIIDVSDTVVCALTLLSSIVAVPFNLLVLFALYHATTLHRPSKALLSSLALSDLGVGVIVQPLYIAYKWAQIHGDLPSACNAGIVSHIEGSHFSAVSFLTMTAISVDRLLALVMRIRYHSVVTIKRVFFLLFAIWLLSGVWASFWVTNQRIYSFITIVLIPICLLVTLSSYVKIYLCLRRQNIQMGTHAKQPSTSLEIQTKDENTPSQIRYRRSVVSMFYLFCAFLPYLSHKVLVSILGWRSSTSVLFSFGLTLVYINSSVNPVIYCWRIPDVRRIVTSIFRNARSIISNAFDNFMPTGNRVGSQMAQNPSTEK